MNNYKMAKPELYFSKYNPYDFYKHRVFVPEDTKDLKGKPEPPGKPGKPEPPGKPVSGGTRKNKRKSVQKTKKHF